MPYVNVPNDLSKIKTKIAFNLTKRQLICFGIGAAIGVPSYLLTRQAIGNTVALFAMLTIMLPAFLLAMYEKDGQPFELLANCFGPEDIDTAMQSGAQGVGLLRTGYMMLPGRILDEQEQYFFYCSCLAAAQGRQVTVRTFDFGSDRTISDAYQGLQSSKLGLRGIRSSLRNLPQMAVQICALTSSRRSSVRCCAPPPAARCG